ncbi:hypothetical protein EVAR_76278_1 [Eumeta japonica]|uniref:Uncharacterized protein n=1 Tax=Eumeta variegata TaxID=151549 RepID=A0A4C1UNY0_EUMVA|nr:hypothetical protein EVAR_76278_1 [Eumeta japonica]
MNLAAISCPTTAAGRRGGKGDRPPAITPAHCDKSIIIVSSHGPRSERGVITARVRAPSAGCGAEETTSCIIQHRPISAELLYTLVTCARASFVCTHDYLRAPHTATTVDGRGRLDPHPIQTKAKIVSKRCFQGPLLSTTAREHAYGAEGSAAADAASGRAGGRCVLITERKWVGARHGHTRHASRN